MKNHHQLLFRILLSIWITPLIILSLYTPGWMEHGTFLHINDKMLHFAGAVVLGFLFPEAFPDLSVVVVLITWTLISTGFEAFQQWATHGHRQFDLRDIGMNLAGFGLAYLIGQLILPVLRRHNIRKNQDLF